MRIACIIGLSWNVPPARYGGTERVMAYLVKGLISLDVDTTLYASGDSTVTSKIRTTSAIHYGDCLPWEKIIDKNKKLFYLLVKEQKLYDIIISFCDENILPFTSGLKTKVVHSLHQPFTFQNMPTFLKYRKLNFISTSIKQRKPLRQLNYIDNIYNGVEVKNIPYRVEHGNRLSYLGSIHHGKGTHLLAGLAAYLGETITIAGKIDDQEYFDNLVEPKLGKFLDFIGELNDEEKYKLFLDSRLLLYPTQCRDSCPITVLEAMATGLPVVAINRGSLAELIGNTGYLVEDIEEMAAAILTHKKTKLVAEFCRIRVKQYFDSELMTKKYLRVCRKLLWNSPGG